MLSTVWARLQLDRAWTSLPHLIRPEYAQSPLHGTPVLRALVEVYNMPPFPCEGTCPLCLWSPRAVSGARPGHKSVMMSSPCGVRCMLCTIVALPNLYKAPDPTTAGAAASACWQAPLPHPRGRPLPADGCARSRCRCGTILPTRPDGGAPTPYGSTMLEQSLGLCHRGVRATKQPLGPRPYSEPVRHGRGRPRTIRELCIQHTWLNRMSYYMPA